MLASAGRSAIVVTSDKLSFISPWPAASVFVSGIGRAGILRSRLCRRDDRQRRSVVRCHGLLSAFLLKSIYLSGDDPVDGAAELRADRETSAIPGRSWKVLPLLQYLLLGPVCSLAAAHYISAWSALMLNLHGSENNGFALAACAFAVTALAWLFSRRGDEKYRRTCFRVAQALTVLVVILVAWCVVTVTGHRQPRAAISHHIVSNGGEQRHNRQFSMAQAAHATAAYHRLARKFRICVVCVSGLRTLPLVWRYIGSPKNRRTFAGPPTRRAVMF